MNLNSRLTGSPIFKKLRQAMQVQALLMDGAMGTCLQDKNLTAKDFGGEEYEGCNEYLNLITPAAVQDIHEQYYRAGADIVETNSFGSTPLVLAEYGLSEKAYEISKASAEVARAAAKACADCGRDLYVAGSMGPTTKAYTVTGGVTFETLVDSYCVQAKGLIDGGVDFLLLETAQDTVNLKAGVAGIKRALEELDAMVPLAVSVTIEQSGTMLAGQNIEALCVSLSHLELLALGMNCSTGPDLMIPHLRALHQICPFPVLCMPNAGLPDENGLYQESPEGVGKHLMQFIKDGWVHMIGGCCGTNPSYIKKYHELRQGVKPVFDEVEAKSYVSGIEVFELQDDNRPVIVGERTNVIGSKKFRNLICDEKWEDAADVGRKQVKAGAQVLDLCLGNPDREEIDDVASILPWIVRKVKVPVMIDTTNDDVFELASSRLPGKCLFNSVNLEHGEERLARVAEITSTYGGHIVVGCIDEDPEDGMAVTVARKLEVAKRAHGILTEKYGVKEWDIAFDPLVFPCGTGDEKYLTSAKETIEGVRAIKQALPRCRTVLGVSNVSFGLPPAGREVLNSVFLYHCTLAGLDMAIVNSQKLVRYASLSDEEKGLAEALIFNNSKEALDKFVEFFRGKNTKQTTVERSSLSVEEQLVFNLVEGTKEGLEDSLKEALNKYAPLEIVNGPLMGGMSEVGKLFNDNKLIVAEVLQSASVMKAAVRFLEPLMEKSESSQKGKFLIATVKGDVHDIGKNLVQIIVSNNGFDVVDLGIKVDSSTLIEAIKEHKPDYIGLSGLLVKSALQMIDTARDLKQAGITLPVLVGGAALSRKFVDGRIQPVYDGKVYYSVDAMSGLDILNQLTNAETAESFEKSYREESEKVLSNETPKKVSSREQLIISHDELREQPADFERHVVHFPDTKEILSYINEHFFYQKHLGYKGSINKAVQAGEAKAIDLKARIEALIRFAVDENLFDCRGVYQCFKAASKGNDLTLFRENGEALITWNFPRQEDGELLSVADFVGTDSKEPKDTMALFAVTAATQKYYDALERFKSEDDFLSFHALQALSLEAAEATAEFLHKKLREQWGIKEDLSLLDLFQTKYQGIRLSFGYPACPELEKQKELFSILKPEEIGIELTENYMMHPEGSVTAMAFTHPSGKYFRCYSSNDM
jgi:5-methyltetrahydrofolate--homocysteine methyltransferase